MRRHLSREPDAAAACRLPHATPGHREISFLLPHASREYSRIACRHAPPPFASRRRPPLPLTPPRTLLPLRRHYQPRRQNAIFATPTTLTAAIDMPATIASRHRSSPPRRRHAILRHITPTCRHRHAAEEEEITRHAATSRRPRAFAAWPGFMPFAAAAATMSLRHIAETHAITPPRFTAGRHCCRRRRITTPPCLPSPIELRAP